MNIKNKLIILFLLLSLVPIGVISVFSYATSRESIVNQVVNQLNFVASIQESRIRTIIEQDLERIDFVSNHNEISGFLQSSASESGAAEYPDMKDILTSVQSVNQSFKDLFLLNAKGNVVASTRQGIMGENYSKEEFFVHGSSGKTIANFFFDEDRNLRVYLSAPVRSSDNLLGVVVVVESDVDNILSLIRDYSGLGKSGELMLARRDEYGNAIFIAPSRFHANAALSNRIKPELTSDPMIQALSGKEVVIPSVLDYRGKQVIAATRYIEETDWGLVVKMDREEAFAPIDRLTNYFFYTAIITSLIAMLNAWFFAQTLTRPILALSNAAREIEKGHLDQHVTVNSRDEIGILASSFNIMAKRLQLSYAFLEDRIREKTTELAGKVQETQRQIAKLSSLLESIGDGVIAADAEEKVMLINSAACEMLGVKRNNALGKKIYSVFLLGDKLSGKVSPEVHPITSALTKRRKIFASSGDGYTITRSEGTRIPISLTVTPVMLDNQIIGTILVFRDVTIPWEIDRMKNEFISLASHQLRTPLSAIKWFVGMLIAGDIGPLSAQQKEMIGNVYDANQRMIDLVNSLLNISRIESGKLVMTLKPSQISEIIQSAVADLDAAVKKKKQKISVDIEPGLPNITIDQKLIREAFDNILSNAVKYTPEEGKIEVRVNKKNGEIVTQIKDTGYGIPLSEQTKVFQKFYRGENIISKDTEGSGLGLYFARKVVQSSGGSVWFSSREGAGTTFWISLPIVPGPVYDHSETGFNMTEPRLQSRTA